MNILFSLRLLIFTTIIFAVCGPNATAQRPMTLGSTTQQPQYDSQGRIIPNSPQQKGGDSLKHRDNTDDSITIHYRYFDSTTIRNLDSSINDFTTRYPLPANYVTLGNLGTASHSLLFNPNM